MREDAESQSNEYNRAAIVLLAVTGLLIVGLVAILFADNNEETHYTKDSELKNKPSQPPTVVVQPQFVRQVPPLLFTPSARYYAPFDYEPEINGQNGMQMYPLTGSHVSQDVVHRAARLLSAPRSIRERDWGAVSLCGDNVSTKYNRRHKQQRAINPGSTFPEAVRTGSAAYAAGWPAPELESSVLPPPRVSPTYGEKVPHSRYLHADDAQAYDQPYTQPYFTPAHVPTRDTTVRYPVTDYYWLPPEQLLNPSPRYTQHREYYQRYREGW